jgi:hypothetical protein
MKNISFILLISSFILFTIVLAATPVGGWCESNPHHEDYKFAFCSSILFCFGSLILLYVENKSENKAL